MNKREATMEDKDSVLIGIPLAARILDVSPWTLFSWHSQRKEPFFRMFRKVSRSLKVHKPTLMQMIDEDLKPEPRDN
jgi:hypothetical protein